MENRKLISGFSKLSKSGKLKWIVENFFESPLQVARELKSYWLADKEQQKLFDGFCENTITNYVLPYGVVPNMIINGKTYCVPMVTEESSVIAAASAAAKYWVKRGGIHAEVKQMIKPGQVHFKWFGDPEKLKSVFPSLEIMLRAEAKSITTNMENRGGGIVNIELRDLTNEVPGYYQLFVDFETCDSMGANFINSVLEQFANTLSHFVKHERVFTGVEKEVEVIMSILSNYTPDCIVKAWVQCPIKDLMDSTLAMDTESFAERFYTAVKIAEIDVHRATTHNKGIFNGIDAVVIATGNDFRAVEADGHAYASRNGKYSSLSECILEAELFTFTIEMPVSIGTIGGLTRLHPMANRSLELLGNPNANELMQIIVATGLMQNFSAVRSLVTTGIQKGHMKMHFLNMLNHLNASKKEIDLALEHFSEKEVSFSAVRNFISALRQKTETQIPI